jgi:hypothetical protein
MRSHSAPVGTSTTRRPAMMSVYNATSPAAPTWRAIKKGGFGDHEAGGDQRTWCGLEQRPARLMIGIIPVRGRDQRARINDEHRSGVPEPVGKQSVRIAGASPNTTRGSHPGDGQTATGEQMLGDRLCDHEIHAHPAPRRLGTQCVEQLLGQIHCHRHVDKRRTLWSGHPAPSGILPFRPGITSRLTDGGRERRPARRLPRWSAGSAGDG